MADNNLQTRVGDGGDTRQPGAPVNIVLKADQPTGRTVQGVVRDLLTRGNHPRGIKVQLADGRVGRVQSMATGSAATSSSTYSLAPAATTNPGGAGSSSLGEGGPSPAPVYDISTGRPPRRGGRRGGNESRGFDGDDEPGLPSQQIGLDAYVKQSKPRRAGRGKGKSAPASIDDDEEEEQGGAVVSEAPPSEIVTCPVCATFEGDETAVAYHVAAHFDTGS